VRYEPQRGTEEELPQKAQKAQKERRVSEEIILCFLCLLWLKI